ncbi:rhomboid-related protein 4 [Rhipicephalus sanguineus]|uniref:Peptidase S54 rhomboid domain-containing protein n=1 Tax=Rhipicephalus sanguineus TaxID=34632 RepID=A0A9D4PRR0_RHISA|nr:rhomboid-related protein 4 [Rhipicephalus sanguineus]KAH7951196.1 hypothetical protein HPB52_006253 [Rhipicephalus sanguineus]
MTHQTRVQDVYGAVKLLFYALFRVGLGSIPPATFLTVIVQACVYLRLFSLPWSKPEEACVSVAGVLFKGEWPRIFYGAIEHGDSMHLCYNMVSFMWKGINLEEKMGTVPFFCVICLLTVLTGAFMVGLNYLLGTYVDAIFYERCIIGFSGVIFAIKLLDNVKYPAQTRNIFGVSVSLPSGYAVWLELLFVQLMAGNNCSFIGHLAGVLAGFVYLGVVRPIFDLMWLVLVETPRRAVYYILGRH